MPGAMESFSKKASRKRAPHVLFCMGGLPVASVHVSPISLMENKDSDPSRWFVEEALPHERDLRAWAGARFSQVKDLDDLVQEAFLRLLRVRESGPVANPRAFLFVATRNLALNQLRHRRYETPEDNAEVDPMSIADEVSTPLEVAIQEEDINLLVKAIQSLPKRCRQVMTLRKIYGLSQREVAHRLGISEHTVEAQGSIGMRKCINYFRNHGYLARFSE